MVYKNQYLFQKSHACGTSNWTERVEKENRIVDFWNCVNIT
jgi:hypothetical protein